MRSAWKSVRPEVGAAVCFFAASVSRAQDASFFTLPSTPGTTTVEPVAPPLPPEPNAAPYGSRGQLVLSNDVDLSISYTRYESTAEFLYVYFSPAVDWFVIRNVSLGITTGVDGSKTRSFGADSSIIHRSSVVAFVGPRISVNVPIGRFVSFNPRATVGVLFSHSESSLPEGGSLSVPSPVDSASPTVVGPWMTLYTPILFHPVQHFFLGFGPSLYHSFGRVTGGTDQGAEQTTIGAYATVGTYVGGTPPPPAPDYVVTKTRRFGDHHDIVISGSNDLAARWTTYTGTSSSSTSFGVFPAVDVFVGYRIALGVTFGASYSQARGIDALSKLPVLSDHVGVGGGPRIAYDLPLTSWLSLYPRARVVFGYESYNVRSGSNRNAYGAAAITLGLYVPLLVHFSAHAFAGFGPSIAYDVLSNDDFGRRNPSLNAGASTTVGGWL